MHFSLISSLREDNPSSLSDIVNKVLWKNRFIYIDSRSVYSKKLFDAELINIGNLYGANGELKDGAYYCYVSAHTFCASRNTKSTLMSLYLYKENQNSGISPSSDCLRLPAEKLAVICRKLYWNRTFNLYLQMA